MAETRKEDDKAELLKVLGVLKPEKNNEDDVKFLYRTGEREKKTGTI